MSTIKEKRHTIIFSLEDILDVKLMISEGGLLGFVLSYRARIDREWCEVFRVDTAHGYLHRRRGFGSPANPRGLGNTGTCPWKPPSIISWTRSRKTGSDTGRTWSGGRGKDGKGCEG